MNCKVEGCPKRLHAHGMCSVHYQRWKRHGRLTLPTATIPDRFWGKVDQRTPDECWPWTGSVNNHGYGSFRPYDSYKADRPTKVLAHRFAYILATGQDITGKVLLHSCDNPPCCNPAHLTPGTQGDNVRDMWAKGRGSKPPRTKRRYASTCTAPGCTNPHASLGLCSSHYMKMWRRTRAPGKARTKERKSA